MPLTEKGEKIKGAMEEKYGKEKGEKVFYASKNKGTILGVDSDLKSFHDSYTDAVKRGDAVEIKAHCDRESARRMGKVG